MKLKKTLLSVLACMLSIILAIACTACSGGSSDPTVKSVALDVTTVTLGIDDTARLTATVTYSDGKTDDKPAAIDEWTTSDANVATVTRGVVSAKAKGTATITAKAGDQQATCTVTVENITVELNKTSLKLERSEAGEQLTATVKKDGTAMSGETVEWSTSDDKVAKVDATTGFVTPVAEGTATITATRSGHNQKATCEVEIYWDKPVGYKEIAWVEQNKLEENTWGFWYAQDPGWANGTVIEYNEGGVYTEDYTESTADLKEGFEYIGMGKITFEYEVITPNEIWGVQAFYRSTDNVEGGKLAYNHLYELTFTVESNQAGKLGINPYNDVRAQGEEESDEDYEAYLADLEAQGKYTPDNSNYEIVEGKQEVRVVFRHDDCGYIYKEGIYDNMGSALHLQLAGLTDGPVVISVYNFQYKDLGAATYPVKDDFTKHEGYVDPNEPVIPDVPELILTPSEIVATEVTLRVEGEGEEARAIFQLHGTIDMSKFANKAAAEEWLYGCYFDLQIAGGGWNMYQFNREVVSLDESSGAFLIEYDITRLAVSTGNGSGAYSAHFARKDSSEDGYGDNKNRDLKLDADKAVAGTSITVGDKKYTIVNHKDFESTQENEWGQAYNYGCVSIKVENA